MPASCASWVLRIPLVVFLPDVVPGKAVAWLAPLSKRIAVSTEDALQHVERAKTVVTGYPVREAFAGVDRATSRKRFGIPLDATVLVVLGGSQGARAINDGLAASLPNLLTGYHVLHVCGQQRYPEATARAAALSNDQKTRYYLRSFLEEVDMASALAAADLVVCRSGASVLGELPAAGVPAVLVPYPLRSVHQYENAEYLARRGAAVILDNADVQAGLGDVVRRLLSDGEHLQAMAEATRRLARADAGPAIARLIEETAA